MQATEADDPRRIGRHSIRARIGTGGMATVYFGRSPGNRPVAIKVMHAELASNPEYRHRFQREVAATRAVGGRYSPGVFDAGPDDEVPWLAMEFLPAVSLGEAVGRHGPLPPDSVLPFAAGLAEAITGIHRAGVAHLDLTPANVLLTTDGPRVIDYGIAVELGPPTPGVAVSVPAGSRGFMAPEQLGGLPVGPASDAYSFAATLVYACTGTQPADGMPVPVDQSLRLMIEHCLRTDPAARPAMSVLANWLGREARAAGTSGGVPLPPAVVAEIDRRASEAENPPVPLDPQTSRRWTGRPAVSRRTLLLGGGVLTVAGVGSGLALVLSGGRAEAGSGTPAAERTPTTTEPAPESSAPAPTAPPTRTAEFLFFGQAAAREIAVTVNGESTAVSNPTLPWRWVTEIPQAPTPWRMEYRFGPGEYNWRILVDGVEEWWGEGRSSDGFKDHAEGDI